MEVCVAKTTHVDVRVLCIEHNHWTHRMYVLVVRVNVGLELMD